MNTIESIFFLFEYIFIPALVPISILIVLKTASHFHTNPYNENPDAKIIKRDKLNAYLEELKKEKIKKEIKILIKYYEIDEYKQKEFFKLRIKGENFNESINKLQIVQKQDNPNNSDKRVKTIF